MTGARSVSRVLANVSRNAINACDSEEKHATSNNPKTRYKKTEATPFMFVAGSVAPSSVFRATYEPANAEEEAEPSLSHPTDCHESGSEL